MSERMFTTYQVAKILGERPGTVVEWIQSGQLPVREFPDGPSRVPLSGLVQFLKRQGEDVEQILADAAGIYQSNVKVAAHNPATAVPRQTRTPPAKQTDQFERGLLAQSQVAEAILADAAACGAAQVHLEPRGDGLRLRLRVDGQLREKSSFSRLPAELAAKLTDHLKSLAGLNVTQRRLPQSGSFVRVIDGRELQLNLSTCPTVFGEKIFIDLAETTEAAPMLGDLGLPGEDELRLRSILGGAGKLLIVAARPRRGQPAALLALLGEAANPNRSVVAIDRRRALHPAAVNQSRIDPAAGLTYVEALRASEAQDADVIMIRDLRDPETAAAAIEAARDGRVVIAGMIAGSASEAIEGLLEMGVEPWALAGTLSAIIEERQPAGRSIDAPSQPFRFAVTYVEGQIAAAIRAGKAVRDAQAS
ncbi:MAG: ATPase, T2SS/T4P/T4SS family [Planctomycetota bacterium]|jgi:type II secretory ATPase GspE/PulE/Tfp pilus assembly ATPase PilB-like protein